MFKVTEPQPRPLRPVVPELPQRQAVTGVALLKKIAILLIIAVAVVCSWEVGKANSAIDTSHTIQYVVKPGDTEYGIIVRFNPNSNVRALEDWVSAKNGLHDAQIWPGQVLTVPVKEG
ncbi:LysM peptidoglycan-binding domain-containing protein [Alicyclobacillus sp. SO9]|uniref:LysM peptidoglycan-binding domain-containing protein n=1 Tax=Alicyclobacillus sp. SO9 TaxID=2665646 RepID=UPI0018E821C2|nr:LysM peptidoglycan-binding domain-containing protein [Alicyclobacillus sp. SO9]QQE80895.1 LysM peptidoglycan-binding domain-containing protein [Alicyclobacillus sp. SO9]